MRDCSELAGIWFWEANRFPYSRSHMCSERLPLGIKLLAAFFAFGAAMCLLTIVMLLFPGSALDGIACASAAIGLAKRMRWGIPLALAILTLNLAGDLLNALLRHDLRTLVGLPIGGATIAYLLIARR